VLGFPFQFLSYFLCLPVRRPAFFHVCPQFDPFTPARVNSFPGFFPLPEARPFGASVRERSPARGRALIATFSRLSRSFRISRNGASSSCGRSEDVTSNPVFPPLLPTKKKTPPPASFHGHLRDWCDMLTISRRGSIPTGQTHRNTLISPPPRFFVSSIFFFLDSTAVWPPSFGVSNLAAYPPQWARCPGVIIGFLSCHSRAGWMVL